MTKMRILTEQDKDNIIRLYREGMDCVQIKNKMNLKGHQQVLNVLHKLPDWIPRRTKTYARKYTLNESFFKEINTEEKAYILGFVCADGHIDIITGRLKILLAQKDIDILEKIIVNSKI